MPGKTSSKETKKKKVTSSRKTSAKSTAVKSAKNKAVKPKTTAVRKRKPKTNEEAIRIAAYYNYLNRGCNHGQHEDDWYQAEQSLKKTGTRKKKS